MTFLAREAILARKATLLTRHQKAEVSFSGAQGSDACCWSDCVCASVCVCEAVIRG